VRVVCPRNCGNVCSTLLHTSRSLLAPFPSLLPLDWIYVCVTYSRIQDRIRRLRMLYYRLTSLWGNNPYPVLLSVQFVPCTAIEFQLVSNVCVCVNVCFFGGKNRVMLVTRTNFTGTVFLEIPRFTHLTPTWNSD
jgi:hypothetical protein